MCKLFFGFFALIAATPTLRAQGIFPTNEVCGRLEELGLSRDACEDPMMGALQNHPAMPAGRPKRVPKQTMCCDPHGRPCSQTSPCETAQ